MAISNFICSFLFLLPFSAYSQDELNGHWHVYAGHTSAARYFTLDIADSLVIWKSRPPFSLKEKQYGVLNKAKKSIKGIRFNEQSALPDIFTKRDAVYEIVSGKLKIDTGLKQYEAVKVEPDHEDWIRDCFSHQQLWIYPPIATDTAGLLRLEALPDSNSWSTYWGQLPKTNHWLENEFRPGFYITHRSSNTPNRLSLFLHPNLRKKFICGSSPEHLRFYIDEKVPLSDVFRFLNLLRQQECQVEKIHFAVRVEPENGHPVAGFKELDLPAFYAAWDRLHAAQVEQLDSSGMLQPEHLDKYAFHPFRNDFFQDWVASAFQLEMPVFHIHEVPEDEVPNGRWKKIRD